jgi:tyrosinase
MTEPELKAFRNALGKMMKISDNRGYNYIAGFHGIPQWWCWHHDLLAPAHAAHRAAFFLPWHRAYLKTLEDLLRDQDPNVAQCWWDWSSPLSHKEGIPSAYKVEQVDGLPNPLYKFHISVAVGVTGLDGETGPIDKDTSRDHHPLSDLKRVTNPPLKVTTTLVRDADDAGGQHPSEFGSDIATEVGTELMTLEQFTDFSRALEDIHDFIHGWVGGTMGDLGTAAYDPIFYAHHANIDRIWWMWQLQHGNSTIPSDWLDLTLQPFGYKVRDVLDVSGLGYEYATSSAGIILGGT